MFVDAALSLDIYVSTRTEGEIIDNADQVAYSLDVRRANAGFQAGIGTAIPVGSVHVLIKPEYKTSLRPLNDWPNDFKQRYFNLKVGVRF